MTSDPGVDQADQAIRIAEAYFETENYERGREVLRRSLSQHPDNPGLLAQHARAEYLLENYDGASRSAYAALSAAPQHELAMRIYALSLDGLCRYGDALWMAWQGVKTHPNEPLQHRVYARLLQKSRQLRRRRILYRCPTATQARLYVLLARRIKRQPNLHRPARRLHMRHAVTIHRAHFVL